MPHAPSSHTRGYGRNPVTVDPCQILLLQEPIKQALLFSPVFLFLFGSQVEFYRIKSDNLQGRPAVGTLYQVAFIHIVINLHFRVAFGTRSSGHIFAPPNILFNIPNDRHSTTGHATRPLVWQRQMQGAAQMCVDGGSQNPAGQSWQTNIRTVRLQKEQSNLKALTFARSPSVAASVKIA
jgi:hypothetical protein